MITGAEYFVKMVNDAGETLSVRSNGYEIYMINTILAVATLRFYHLFMYVCFHLHWLMAGYDLMPRACDSF
jgi:hypothetical protein